MFLKHKKWIITALALFVVIGLPVFLVTSTSYGADFMNDVLAKYFGMEQEEVTSELAGLSFDELVKEIDSLAKAGNTEELIMYSGELLSRKDKISNDELLKIINDNTKDIVTQGIMVDLFVAKNENSSQDSLKALLMDPKTDYDTKDKILSNSRFSEEDKEVLKYFIYNDDGILAFRAFRQLSNIDDEEAFEIAKSVLENWPDETDYKISGAQKSVMRYLRYNKDKTGIEDEIKAFIKQTETIFNAPDSSDKVKDSCVFALCDVASRDSLKAIIYNQSIDPTLKLYSVGENYFVLLDVLKAPDCSEQDIEFVLDAMEFLPIKDLKPYIEAAMAKIKDKDLLARCKNMIPFIEKEGVNAPEIKDY